jgi:hypothetical protein
MQSGDTQYESLVDNVIMNIIPYAHNRLMTCMLSGGPSGKLEIHTKLPDE